ncbi:MAG: MotA/TolQ/ExbB proton channel family protein [Gammaproteobacteria bacterium]|nr:MotA/TolQ/ExbB proton channel family protein [Pseudomonadota bacterium]MCH9662270.1 MotA/TolQ/ExbB proton channel family protein [Gammaproteobacteria bacterium]
MIPLISSSSLWTVLASAPLAPVEEHSSLETFANFYVQGGTFMHIILVVMVVGLAIGLERWLKLSRAKGRNAKVWDSIHPVLEEGNFVEARNMAERTSSEMGRLLSLGLSRQGSVRRRDDVEIAMEEGMLEIIPQLEKRTPFIAILSNLATLLGLLGTIVGLIQAFEAVANAAPSEKADLLSASISVAMNTTAFGLMAAIPLLICHALVVSLTTDVVTSLEMASVKTLNIISEFNKKQAAMVSAKK